MYSGWCLSYDVKVLFSDVKVFDDGKELLCHMRGSVLSHGGSVLQCNNSCFAL